MSEPKTRKEMLLDEKWASTPDMGEYLDSSMIQEAAKELSDGKLGGEFYIEKPFATIPGYYQTENVIILSGKPSFQTREDEIGNTGRNRTDGDTVYLEFDELIDGGKEYIFNTTQKPMTPIQLLKYSSTVIENSEMLGIRILGLNAPELPHFRDVAVKTNAKLITAVYGDLVSTDHDGDLVKCSVGNKPKRCFAYAKYNPTKANPIPREMTEVISFVTGTKENEYTGKNEDVYFEVIENSLKVNGDLNSGTTYRIIAGHGEDDDASMERFQQALDAQQDMFKLINEAENVIYMLDQTFLANKMKGIIPYAYQKEYEKISESPFYAFKSLWTNLTQAGENAYQQMGKRYFGQELNGRYLGACYVEQNTSFGKQWINVAKYLMGKYPLIKILPTYSSSGAMVSEYDGIAEVFKTWTYDITKQKYLDQINEKGNDDRADVQRQLTGVDLTELTDHTVMIGDCLLMIPPTSIRTVTQSRSERISMIRSKGTMTKTLPKTERIIEMQVFFNGLDAINGIRYEQPTPSGDIMTYHMNGLRSLMAQFKFTPFLPIHNDYINYVLNIEAVSLVSIQISSVPNYPKTLQATIKMQEFDYRQYMPEILPPDPESKEDLYTNLFSKVIHWPVFRYYYQKSIQAGEDVSDLIFDSEPYIAATVGQKTALQRVKEMSPLFELYVANDEFLKQRKMTKQSLERSPLESNPKLTPEEERFLKEIVTMSIAVNSTMKECNTLLNNLFLQAEFVSKDGELVSLETKTDNKKIVYDSVLSKYPNGEIGICHLKKKENNGILADGVIYVKDRATLYNDYMSKIKTKLIDSIKNSKIDTACLKNYDMRYSQYSSDGITFEYKFGIEVELDWVATGHSGILEKVRKLIAKQEGVVIEDIFKNGKMFIGWSSIFVRGDDHPDSGGNKNVFNTRYINEGGYSIDKNIDYKSLGFLASSFGMTLDDPKEFEGTEDMWKSSDDIGDMKDNIELETSKSMLFDYYDIGSPIINNITLAYNNVFTNMSMKIYDGYASQFTGGSDTSIEIEMTATNEYTVNQLQSISKICTQRLIDYRKILSSSPLRINSEMTRFVGVNEVVIESVDISTIPNYPGTWNVSMRLTSVERTLRNREAMKKLDDITNVQTNMDSIVKTKNFFDVKNTLAKVELYPDLELPTIVELEQLGYYFIKYKAESARVFPDADFYFAYLHVFSSEMLKETIVNFFKDPDNSKIYREYSGNLFNDDSALIKYNVDNTAKVSPSVRYK